MTCSRTVLASSTVVGVEAVVLVASELAVDVASVLVAADSDVAAVASVLVEASDAVDVASVLAAADSYVAASELVEASDAVEVASVLVAVGASEVVLLLSPVLEAAVCGSDTAVSSADTTAPPPKNIKAAIATDATPTLNLRIE